MRVLEGGVAELGGEPPGLLACRDGAVVVPIA